MGILLHSVKYLKVYLDPGPSFKKQILVSWVDEMTSQSRFKRVVFSFNVPGPIKFAPELTFSRMPNRFYITAFLRPLNFLQLQGHFELYRLNWNFTNGEVQIQQSDRPFFHRWKGHLRRWKCSLSDKYAYTP